MDANETAWALKALLDWQAELGADAAIAETPQDRYGEVAAAPVPSAGAMSGRVAAPAAPPRQAARGFPTANMPACSHPSLSN